MIILSVIGITVFVAAAIAMSMLFANHSADVQAPVHSADQVEVSKLTLDRLNKEKEMSASLLATLQAKDPSVKDVQFVMDENGKRTIRVAREGDDGLIHTWQAPTAELEKALENPQQFDEQEGSAKGPSGGGSNWLLHGMMGYMLANMFNSRGAAHAMSPAAYAKEKATSAATYASSVRAANNSNVAARRAMPSSAKSLGTSRSGSFAGSGARSGGYSGGG